MAVIRTYHCPVCRTSVSPLLGLLMKPFVQCSRCPTRVYVSRDMVVDNWTRNFYLQGVLAIWVGLTAHMVMFPAGSTRNLSPFGIAVGMLLVGWLPGLIGALLVVPIGHFLGHVVACFLVKGPPPPEVPTHRLSGSGYVPREHEWR